MPRPRASLHKQGCGRNHFFLLSQGLFQRLQIRLRDGRKQSGKAQASAFLSGHLDQFRSSGGRAPGEARKMRTVHFDSLTVNQSLGPGRVLKSAARQPVGMNEPEGRNVRPHFRHAADTCVISLRKGRVTLVAAQGAGDPTAFLGRRDLRGCGKSKDNHFRKPKKGGNANPPGVALRRHARSLHHDTVGRVDLRFRPLQGGLCKAQKNQRVPRAGMTFRSPT